MSHKFTLLLVIFSIMVVLCACAPSQPNTPTLSATIQGDLARGEQIFNNGKADAPACATCHTLDSTTKVGPGLGGLADRAGTRVSGMSASDYVYQHVVSPGFYVVPGFGNIMYNQYAAKLSPQDIADVMAYVLGPATANK
ncbi:MAG TPA: cytochrome c [Aggregatilineales bacterium]|nr:cytochrome c [Aggregatilineales bacterium]